MDHPTFFQEIVHVLTAAVKGIWDLLNSNFGTALAGAAAGALGSYLISLKISSRQELIKEHRNINAALVVAGGLAESCLAVKEQHVKPLKEKFDQQKAAILRDRSAAQHIQLDIETLEPIHAPVEKLQNILIDGVSPKGRLLKLATRLPQVVSDLNRAIENRNTLCEEFRKTDPLDARVYFGIEHGHVHDNRYNSIVDGIYLYLDSAIYFSIKLCEDLHTQGEGLRGRIKRYNQKTIHYDFSRAVEEGLFPDESKFEEWNSSFQ